MKQSALIEDRGIDLLSNPFGISTDSLCDLPYFAPDSVSTVVPFIGQSCHQDGQNFSNNNLVKTDSFLFYILIISILGVAILGNYHQVNLKSFFKIGFSEKLIPDHERKQVNNNPYLMYYLVFTSIVFISVITYVFLSSKIHFFTIKYLWFLFFGILTFMLLKTGLIFLLGKIFYCDHLTKDFIRKFYLMYSFLIFFLIIPALLSISTTINAQVKLFGFSMILLILFCLIRDGKFLIKQISKNKSFIFFFVYLCTLEILSVPLLAKLLYLLVL